MNEIYKSLHQNKIQFKQTGPYKVECTAQIQQHQVAFAMELNHLEDLANIILIKFKRINGEMAQYRSVSGNVLKRMVLV